MEWLKGILKVKGDWYQVHYRKNANKSSNIDVPKTIDSINKDWVEKEVEFQLVNGAISNIKYQGEKIETLKLKSDNQILGNIIRKNDKPPKESLAPSSGIRTEKIARSPYNFVPLNSSKAALTRGISTFDRYIENTNSGYLDLEVINLTPLFIRQVSNKDDSFRYSNENYGIPGSSFRGMIRQLSEILSFGNFGKFDDRRMYFRGTLITMDKIRAAVMTYEDGVYNVYPCKYDVENNNRKVNDPVNIFDDGNTVEFTTGKFGGKYSKFIFSDISSKHTHNISENSIVYKDYINDKSRDERVPNIFKEARIKRFPIFFQTDEKDQVDSIGFAKFHRIPYDKTISNHIPNAILKSDNLEDSDIVQNLFGDTFDNGMVASRISFSDLMSSTAETFDVAQLLKILSSPKPTTFQHYLDQNTSRKVLNWNSDADISGFKMYWHRKASENGTVDISWNENNSVQKSRSHTERVKPIKPNATFNGKIWFQNLSDLELGLLLMALEPNCAVGENEKMSHKIGLAKPLGLGSIKVKVEGLKVFEMSKEGYFSSFAPSKPTKELDVDVIKNNFDAECAKALGLDGGSIWDTDRLKELKAMMLWNEKEVVSPEWLQKTRYMEIERNDKLVQDKNEFKKRPILPRPSEVKINPNSKFI